MFLPKPQDAIHKAWLYRLLSAIYDEPRLAQILYFKGGTCAAMLHWLDRFSVDLDFDYLGTKKELAKNRKVFSAVFDKLGLEIKDQSRQTLQYFLRYTAHSDRRNTIKIDASFPVPQANEYKPFRLEEIDRIVRCQTKETMFANKLVALIDRYEQREAIAGRDLYDVHHFFLQGFGYKKEVIIERRGVAVDSFLKDLINFVQKKITQRVIDQDLNSLLTAKRFQALRRSIKQESLVFLRDELKRLPGA